MTDHLAHNLAKLLVIGMVVQLLVVGYAFYSNYQGRKALATAQQQGCERAKLDRAANARGWRRAEEARRADGQNDVADDYANIASGLEARSKIVCKDKFPDATLFP